MPGPPLRPARGSLRVLAGSCHPMPSLAVTAFATALAVSAGVSAPRVVLLAAAVLSGQLSVGWLNDYVDRGIDRAAGRTDKPLSAEGADGADGGPAERQVRVALVVAAGACVVTSLALGWRPGLLHLVAVGSAYSYDLWLKWTVVSWLPFAVSFGLLPAVVTTALAGHPWPQPSIGLAGALLGVGAHLANTVKDTEADEQTGVRGFPQRIGPHASLVLAAGLIAVAGFAVAVADPSHWSPWVFAVAALVAATVAAVAGRRTAFVGAVVAAGLVVLGVVLSGGAVSR
jgi:4-hydroxybenzoate polyprenyltransferase